MFQTSIKKLLFKKIVGIHSYIIRKMYAHLFICKS